MRALALALVLACSQLHAYKAPWSVGRVVDMDRPEGLPWAGGFILGQITPEWGIYNCGCDLQDLMRVRVGLRRSSAFVESKGQPLGQSAKEHDEEDGSRDHYLHRLRYLGLENTTTIDGFHIIIFYFEALPNQ